MFQVQQGSSISFKGLKVGKLKFRSHPSNNQESIKLRSKQNIKTQEISFFANNWW